MRRINGEEEGVGGVGYGGGLLLRTWEDLIIGRFVGAERRIGRRVEGGWRRSECCEGGGEGEKQQIRGEG